MAAQAWVPNEEAFANNVRLQSPMGSAAGRPAVSPPRFAAASEVGAADKPRWRLRNKPMRREPVGQSRRRLRNMPVRRSGLVALAPVRTSGGGPGSLPGRATSSVPPTADDDQQTSDAARPRWKLKNARIPASPNVVTTGGFIIVGGGIMRDGSGKNVEFTIINL